MVSLAQTGDAGAACTVTVLWRGIQPPPTETYSANTALDCNTCHGMASANDYVWDTALELSGF